MPFTKTQCILLAMKNRKPVVSNDAYNDKRFCLDVMKRLKKRSFMSVPLILKENVIGVLDFYHTIEPRVFSDAQVDFAGKLAASISLAIENARIYEVEHNIADTLQKALLTVPKNIKGIDYGLLYRPATEITMVGGDFYDLFEISSVKIGMVVGDVSGKGLEAATLTSLVKNTIKAYAYHQDSPSVVLKKTNTIIADNSSINVFVSLFFGILDIETGKLAYCSAGHPPALIKKPEGAIPLLTRSPVAGAFKNQTFKEETETMAGGDILLLYTDGIIEARADGELFGEERLIELFNNLGESRVKEIPSIIFKQTAAFADNKLSDDIALVAVGLSKT